MKRKNFLMVVIVLGLLLWVNFAFAEDWNSKLLDAAKNSDIEGVKTALAKGADVNAEKNAGFTALMEAAKKGHKDICELLISKGADVNAKDNVLGDTALMVAAQHGHKDICELLISKGADVNARDNDGWTALMKAAYYSHKDVVGLLISKGANLNTKSNDGTTMLMYAARGGIKEFAELLISKGADVNAKDNDGITALMKAAESGHKDICEFLISKGADVKAKDNEGGTAIIAAAFVGHKDVVKFLLEHGADPLSDKTCQAMAMSVIKLLTMPCQTYAVDYGHAPIPEGGWRLVPITTFKGALSPDYIQYIPESDPWGNPYMYLCWDNGADFAIISYGKDGAPDRSNEEEYIRSLLTNQKPIATSCYQSDIIWLNDKFVVLPEGEQKDCKKSNAN